MKKSKEKWVWRIGMIVVGMIALVSITIAASGGSFWDKVAIYTADIIGGKIEVPDLENINIGALPGPDIQYPYLSVNGWRTQYVQMTMNKATTTLCSIKTPNNASTTLARFQFSIQTGTSTAATLVLSESTNISGTSTATNIMPAVTVAANVGLQSNTIPAVGTNNMLIEKDHYILLMTEGAGLGGYTYTGTCQAEFIDFQ